MLIVNSFCRDSIEEEKSRKRLIFYSERGVHYANKGVANIIEPYKTVAGSTTLKVNC